MNPSIQIIILKIINQYLFFYLGCGNGKYLSVNHSIFKVGVDRCKRFTDIAREKENEVNIYIYVCTLYNINNYQSDIGNRFLMSISFLCQYNHK